MPSSKRHPNSGDTRRLPVFGRLLAVYAKPFSALIALSVLLSIVFSAGQVLRAYLIKPILDNVLLPSAQAKSATPDWLPDLGLFGEAPEKIAAAPPEQGLSLAAKASEKQRLEHHLRESVINIVMLSLLVIFAMPVVQFARTYLVESMLGRVYIEMQRDICAKLLALPLRYHQDRHRGDLLSRTFQDIRGSHTAVSLLFSDFVQASLTACVGICMLLFISWQLALIFALVGPALFAVISAFTRKISNSARRRQQTYADVTQRLIEILEGIKIIKAFRAEDAEDAAFRQETQTLFRRSMKVVKKRILARSLIEMLNNGIAIGTLIVGMVLVVQGYWSLTPGDLAAFAAVLATTYKPIKSLAKGWVRLIDAQPSTERFFEIIDSPVEIQDSPAAISMERLKRGICVRDVSFSYGREPVLHQVSFEVCAGEVAAIVGPTGSGKTTLVDLLLRFYDPTEGCIEIDGVDLRQIQRDSLYQNISVVTQEPFLFDASILENIRFGRPGSSDAEVMAAAKAANVDEFASQFPQGFDTGVGAGGVRLSGGQRQRVTIARAILRDPAFLIFDEATSSLDSKSERLVQDAIETLFGERTVLLVAHRLSTVARADKIIVLEDGRITQTGTHKELLAETGLYRELVGLQA